MSLAYPAINPIALSLGPLHVRWYALAYLTGFILGWQYCLRAAAGNKDITNAGTPKDYDDFLTWAIFAVVLGGRIGYVFFYNLPFYAQHPIEALMIQHGGMSFHGGMIGVVLAGLLFCRKRRLNPLAFGDLIAAAAPIGLFFGRIANFINGELYGHVTAVPWGVVFPNTDGNPRHPSQIYEALLEGLLLFVVLGLLLLRPNIRRRPGLIMGVFFAGYALCRMLAEIWRLPDPQLGYLFWGAITMGQVLSLPMLIAGLYLVGNALKQPPETVQAAQPTDNAQTNNETGNDTSKTNAGKTDTEKRGADEKGHPKSGK